MTYLLDTHILLWLLQDSKRLSQKTRDMLSDPENNLRVSVISYIEISIKRNLGKLKVDCSNVEIAAEDFGVKTIPLLSAHAREFERLPVAIKDPFDRIILATAIATPMYLLTADSNLIDKSELVIEN